jgi:N utilization substance protein B
MRTEAREAVLKILYSKGINPAEEEGLKRGLFSKLTAEDYDFAARLLETAENYEERIIQVIDENIRYFKEDRLYPVDRAILTIAVAEILYFDDIPAVVSIDEATGLAQKYSTERSADFVNGVLSGVMKQWAKS